jgi:hypothetical protein
MMGLFALGFTIPAVLGALFLLPGIWWLLRMIPPKPERIAFPPTRLLADIATQEETPNRSPWWLTALRLLLAAALIIALSGPIWQPTLSGDPVRTGRYWLVIDNGWAAAPYWKERQALAAALIDRANDNNRPIALIATADGASQSLDPVSANEARSRLQSLEPRGWTPDRASLITALTKSAEKTPPGSIDWLSDNLDDGNSAAWGTTLASIAGPSALTVHFNSKLTPLVLVSTENGLKSLDAKVERIETGLPRVGRLRALDQKGREVATTELKFDAGATSTIARFELPTELRNDIARVEIVDEGHAAAVQLLDERWRRRTIGLISGATTEADQPLLSPAHYLETALKPFADVRQPTGDDLNRNINDLLKSNVSVIVTADVGTLVGETEKSLETWVGRGGVLVRFAGPKLAAIKGGDKLVPVDLRQGGRTLGGALSWSKPQALASFSQSGPFATLPVPKDVTVTRQVLAEQHPDLERKTWASLADGTPLVTAARFGNGWLVLFHVTADTSWSNLPLSGSFVEMLRRVISFSIATSAKPDVANPDDTSIVKTFLPPMRILDGYGHSASPTSEAKPIPDGGATISPTREHPPGLYGTEDAYVALEPMLPGDTITGLDLAPLKDATIKNYASNNPIDLKPWVFGLAIVFLILDTIAVLVLNGGFRFRRIVSATAAIAGIAFVLGVSGAFTTQPANAQTAPAPVAATPAASATAKAASDAFDREAALGTRLAYVVTGNAEIDNVSKRGLEGLTRVLSDRTALEASAPLGVDPSRDELAFFPLIYWAVDANTPQPSPQALTRIDAFMKGGGTILFDTRDALEAPTLNGTGRVSPATAALRRILSGLDIPELEPVPSDHVLTKSFYLLQDYPGRYEGGQLWVEATPPQKSDDPSERPVRAGDGVSPIIITSNDLAGAWALDDGGDYLLPTVPPEPRQREMAFRVGVNIVMYTLTGNYKSDQVHVPALLERLGQ